jgi:hypothetical protein
MPRLPAATRLLQPYGPNATTVHDYRRPMQHDGDSARSGGLHLSMPKWDYMGAPTYVHQQASPAHNTMLSQPTRPPVHYAAGHASVHRPPPHMSAMPPAHNTTSAPSDNGSRMAAMTPMTSKYRQHYGQLGGHPIPAQHRMTPPPPYMVYPQVVPQHGPQPPMEVVRRGAHRHPLTAYSHVTDQEQDFRVTNDTLHGNLFAMSVEVPLVVIMALCAALVGAFVALLMR